MMTAKGENDFKDYVEVKPGTYQAIVKDIEFKPDQPAYGGGVVDKLSWKVEITNGVFEGQTISGLTTANMHPKSTMRAWLKAFYRPLEEGEQVDVDDVIGAPCLVQVKQGSKMKNSDQHWTNIENLIYDPTSGFDLMDPIGSEDIDDEDEAPKPRKKKNAKKPVAKKVSKEQASEEVDGMDWSEWEDGDEDE